MLIVFKPDKNIIFDYSKTNLSQFDSTYLINEQNEQCWRIVEHVKSDVIYEPSQDTELLNKIHIVTLVIVGLFGAFLVLFLLICACFSNETVSQLMCKRKTLVNKGMT